MTDRKQKILAFCIALTDVYKDEDERELNNIPAIKVADNGDVTEDCYCILRAVQIILIKFTGNDDMDTLDALALLNKIAFQFSKHEDGESDEENL